LGIVHGVGIKKKVENCLMIIVIVDDLLASLT